MINFVLYFFRGYRLSFFLFRYLFGRLLSGVDAVYLFIDFTISTFSSIVTRFLCLCFNLTHLFTESLFDLIYSTFSWSIFVTFSAVAAA